MRKSMHDYHISYDVAASERNIIHIHDVKIANFGANVRVRARLHLHQRMRAAKSIYLNWAYTRKHLSENLYYKMLEGKLNESFRRNKSVQRQQWVKGSEGKKSTKMN